MDRYAYVLNIIEIAHKSAQELPTACAQLNGYKEAHQRLVNTYGRERVSSSPNNSSPALDAIIRYEDGIAALERQIEEYNRAQEKIKPFIAIIKNRSYAQILEMYCFLGWSHAKIARSLNRSLSTVRRKYTNIVQIIAQETTKKEAGA